MSVSPSTVVVLLLLQSETVKVVVKQQQYRSSWTHVSLDVKNG